MYLKFGGKVRKVLSPEHLERNATAAKSMNPESSVQLKIATLFHGLLFAYQKGVKNVLGSGSEVFVQPMLEILERVSIESEWRIFESGNLDEAVASFCRMLVEGHVVKNIRLVQARSNRYLLKVDGCVWAKRIHEELQPKDVTCPIALILMSIYRRYTNEKVEETESRYLREGTETEIKPLFSDVQTVNVERIKSAAK